DGLCAAPSREALARLAPAGLRRLGLHARRAAALVRIVRALDLERLHGVSTDAAAARLERERGLGPWSVGVVCLQGLGRAERGLAVVCLRAGLGRNLVPGEEPPARRPPLAA